MECFNVAARAVLHLGSELITSDEIAIFELIKNAFDAGSERVDVQFIAPVSLIAIQRVIQHLDTHKAKSEEVTDELKSHILHELRSGRRAELAGPVIEYFNEMLFKLSNCRSISGVVSTLDALNYIEISDTGSGMSKDTIRTAFLRIGTAHKVGKNNPRDASLPLLGNKGIGRLAMMRLGAAAEVTTWVKQDSVDKTNAYQIIFDWSQFRDLDKPLEAIKFPLNEVDRPTKSASGTTIKITKLESDWAVDRVKTGLIDKFLRRLHNPFTTDQARFPIDVTVNKGSRLPIAGLDENLWNLVDKHLTFTFNSGSAKEVTDNVLSTVLDGPDYNGNPIITTRDLGDVCRKLDVGSLELKQLGSFKLSLRWYNRSSLAKNKLGSKLQDMRRELDIWSGGIAIYRDGFRVGLSGSEHDGDWLGLDKEALKKGGYVVNRLQVIGALEISLDGNPGFLDRSNREGLIENQETILLKTLIDKFAINELRERVELEKEIEKTEAIAQILADGTGDIHNRLKQASQNLSVIKSRAPTDLAPNITSLDKHLHFIASQVKKFEDAAVHIKEERENILELAGIGTVMNGVLHELTRTTAQTRYLLGEISRTADKGTKELLEKLESEIKAINTRLRQLDPLTPGARHRKNEFDVVKLTRTILDGYSARFERHNIKAILTVDDASPSGSVLVTMVTGFFSLAVENLLTNSVYWVQQGLRSGETDATIYIDIDSYAMVLTVEDNGPGVALPDRERVFNPGFSLRPNGSGFGLYIAKEVAVYHGATLDLEPSENDDGRLRRFSLQLPKDRK